MNELSQEDSALVIPKSDFIKLCVMRHQAKSLIHYIYHWVPREPEALTLESLHSFAQGLKDSVDKLKGVPRHEAVEQERAELEKACGELLAQRDAQIAEKDEQLERAKKAMLEHPEREYISKHQALRDTITRLENTVAQRDAQIAGLVGVLEELSRLGNGENPGNSEGNRIAQKALSTLPAEWLARHKAEREVLEAAAGRVEVERRHWETDCLHGERMTFEEYCCDDLAELLKAVEALGRIGAR